MLIKDAQREVRRVYQGGLAGQAISGFLWLGSAITAQWGTPKLAMLILVLGGFAIYPAISIVLKASGRPASLSANNPFRLLAIQVAFVLPLSMPLLAPVAAYRLDWFYPAMMILLGAHYLPFATLYGMRSFLALAAALIISGVVIALYLPYGFATGGWVTSIVLFIFAGIGFMEARRSAAAEVQRHP